MTTLSEEQREEQREAFELFYQTSVSYKDIAEEYGQGDKSLQAMAFLKGWEACKEAEEGEQDV